MKIFGKVTNAIQFVLKVIVSVLCLAILALMFTEVIRRYFFGKTWNWSDELIRYMLVYLSMLGGAAAFKAKAFVGFDLVLNKLPPVAGAVVNLVNNTIVAIFSLFIAWCTYQRCILRSTLNQVSTVLKIPMVYMYGIIGVAMLLIFIFAVENYFELIPRLRTAIQNKRSGGETP